jgi:hypothetical protein
MKGIASPMHDTLYLLFSSKNGLTATLNGFSKARGRSEISVSSELDFALFGRI